MDAYLHQQQRPRSFGVMFAEDFDLPAAAPEPEIIEPLFSAADLAAMREAAWREGHTAGLQEASVADTAITREAMQAILAALDAAQVDADERAERSAAMIASLLLDSLAASFPALCARYGAAEAQAIVHAVLPTLTQEAAITVRISPHIVPLISLAIGRLDPDLASRVQITECQTMLPGDIRIAWCAGAAMRDTADLWEQVKEILGPAGFLQSQVNVRELVDG